MRLRTSLASAPASPRPTPPRPALPRPSCSLTLATSRASALRDNPERCGRLWHFRHAAKLHRSARPSPLPPPPPPSPTPAHPPRHHPPQPRLAAPQLTLPRSAPHRARDRSRHRRRHHIRALGGQLPTGELRRLTGAGGEPGGAGRGGGAAGGAHALRWLRRAMTTASTTWSMPRMWPHASWPRTGRRTAHVLHDGA